MGVRSGCPGEGRDHRPVTVEEHRRYELARRQFALWRQWWLHAAVYVAYNGTLFLVVGEPSPQRYLWWGLGLLAHAALVRALGARLAAWEERAIRRRAGGVGDACAGRQGPSARE